MSDKPYFVHPRALVESDRIGDGTRVWAFAHILKGAVVGSGCNVGDHCYIEDGVIVGDDVVIKNGVALWDGVRLEDRVFVGPFVTFTNDLVPRAKVHKSNWDKIVIREGASLGANTTLIAPRTVGRYALVGAGAVVKHDVPDYGLVYGNPARLAGFVCRCGLKLSLAIDQDGEAGCSCGLAYQKQGITVRMIGP